MSVYVTKEFARFARKVRLANAKLLQAAQDVAAGHYDADLGGGVFKQRVAREGGGKSGGFRTIILFRVGSHGFFAHGFAKSDKANVSAKELKALKRLADLLLGYSEEQLVVAQAAGELSEVESDGGDEEQG
ncbi:type II toxin-antitoxin system RelE/ParE family toxin [Acidiphilium sp.]|uniref:type II toxin-antitoxin system RelE/ParE family toxin n=1 Tax=Acidiphilium sp. TaxID=527 RepID=UPI00258E4E7A|nr:type II toxin-antitoxin system RelE/ParE family toxin [Acidiphilium sp.]